jgi:hypothetical protein
MWLMLVRCDASAGKSQGIITLAKFATVRCTCLDDTIGAVSVSMLIRAACPLAICASCCSGSDVVDGVAHTWRSLQHRRQRLLQ